MLEGNKITAVVVAGGSSKRMGFNKLFHKINGREILWHSVMAMQKNEYIDEIVVVSNDYMIDESMRILKDIKKTITFVIGGEERNNSVLNGVLMATDAQYVAIHDGARPFVSNRIIKDTIKLALKYDGAAPAVAVKDTIKVSKNKKTIDETLDRDSLAAIQTPQVFKRDKYIEATKKLGDKIVTDDCMIFENAGYTVAISKGAYANKKITTKEDLWDMAQSNIRVGHGYDVHKLVHDRKLILGGVDIAYEKGLLGHSDADVLTHAIIDALLGSLALGDIGNHFPDTDASYKNADSLVLLEKTVSLINENGYDVINIDATLLCEAPKLSPYIAKIRENIANTMKTDISTVSVKATTEEGLGFTGVGDGISAHCVCLLAKS